MGNYQVAKKQVITSTPHSPLPSLELEREQGVYIRDPYAIITTETLDKLAKALGVPSSALIEDVAEE